MIMCKAKQHYSFEIWDLRSGVDENSRLLGRDTMLVTVSLLPPC